MKKFWILLSIILIASGIGLISYAVLSCNFDFSLLSTVHYQTETVNVTDDFNSISIHANTSDVRLLPSQDGTCSVTVCHSDNILHPVSVINGVLTVATEDHRIWTEHIQLDFSKENASITLYLPAAQYEALTVRISTGDIEIPNNFSFRQMELVTTTGDILCHASATNAVRLAATTGDIKVGSISTSDLNVTVSTGDIKVTSTVCNTAVLQCGTGETYLTDLTCANFTSKGTTGDLTMKSVVASQSLTVERNTGDVRFTQCDAPQISIQTTTGEVNGSLLTNKIFTVNSSTGDIDIPSSTIGGGACEITTTTGYIYIYIP